jgi:hypothetical protein
VSFVAALAYHWHWRESDVIGYPLWQLVMLQDALRRQLQAQKR